MIRSKKEKEREKHKLGLALFKSIKHWEDMILWAVRQDAGDPVELNDMLDALGETWFAEYCALCKHFNDDCDLCVMTPVCDADPAAISAWQQVQFS